MASVAYHGFELCVPQAEYLGEQLGGLRHGDRFTVELTNEGGRHCEVDLSIAGRSCGTFDLLPRRTLRLERPATRALKFVFFRSGTREARLGDQPDAGDREAGVIEARFWEPPPSMSMEHGVRGDRYTPTYPKSGPGYSLFGGEPMAPGASEFTFGSPRGTATGSVSLRGASRQKFDRALSQRHPATWNQVTIMLRLVCLKDDSSDEEAAIMPLHTPVVVSTPHPPRAPSKW